MSEELPYIVIEYSIDGGQTWNHSRTIPAWVLSDKAALAAQRRIVRDLARDEHGGVEKVITRWLSEDDPRAALNQPVV